MFPITCVSPALLVALWSAKMDAVTLRPVGPGDENALFALFSDVRAEELGMGSWEPPLRDVVLRQQFHAQRRGHRAQHPAAGEFLILADDTPAGWTVLDRTGPTWHCVDIAIIPAYRRRKIATRVLLHFQQDAATEGCAVSLMVLRWNSAACSLYDHLGFRIVGGTDTHLLMEWRA